MSGSVGFFLGKRALSKDFKGSESKSHLSNALFARIYTGKTSTIKGPSIEEMKKAAELIGKLNRKSEFLDNLMRQHIEGENYADIIDTELPEDDLHLDMEIEKNKIHLRYGVSPAHKNNKNKKKPEIRPLRDIFLAVATPEPKPNIMVDNDFVKKPSEDFETDSEATQKDKNQVLDPAAEQERKAKEEEMILTQFNKILQMSNTFANESKNRAVRLNDYVHSYKGKAGRFVKLKPIDDFVFTATQTIKFARQKSESLANSLISIVPEISRSQLRHKVYSPTRLTASTAKHSRVSSMDSKELKELKDSKLWDTEVVDTSSHHIKKVKKVDAAGNKFKSIYNDCVSAHKSIVKIVSFLKKVNFLGEKTG